MKVLVGCEESQAVTIAFRELGHEAYSCDLQDCSGGYPEWHIKGDVINEAYSGKYELGIFHPPCTYLSKVGAKHKKQPGRLDKMELAISFFLNIKNSPITRKCIENPIPLSEVTKKVGRYTQIIQPYYFGDSEMKTTCLWLYGLPKLMGLVEVARDKKMFKPSPIGYNKRGNPYYWSDNLVRVSKSDRGKSRSKTFPGIAKAMAEQWGGNVENIKVA